MTERERERMKMQLIENEGMESIPKYWKEGKKCIFTVFLIKNSAS